MSSHIINFELVQGRAWAVKVDCPHEALGADRPCAVWANENGSQTLDQCTFQQHLEACDPEDWLHGTFNFQVSVIANGSGDDWCAEITALPALTPTRSSISATEVFR